MKKLVITDNLAEVSNVSDGNGESQEGRVLVIEIRAPSSSGAIKYKQSLRLR